MNTPASGIVVRFDLLESIDMLTDEECGRLFKAMLQYGSTGEVPDFTGNEKFLWPSVRRSIDLDLDGYTRKVQDNRLKGQYGAYLRKTQLENKVALSYSDWREQQIEKGENKESCGIERNATHTLAIGYPKEANTNTNPNPNTNTNTSVSDPPLNPPQKGEGEEEGKEGEREEKGREGERETEKNSREGELKQAFETFWHEYPKKRGKKEEAQEAFYKAINSGAISFAGMIEALQYQKHSKNWQREEGRYIPLPANWLEKQAWLNVPPEVQESLDAMEAQRQSNQKALKQMGKLQEKMQASIEQEGQYTFNPKTGKLQRDWGIKSDL